MGMSKGGKKSSRYDHGAQENYEFQMGDDFQDEELDDDMAFDSEDERLYGGMFKDKKPSGDYSESEEEVGEDVEFTDSEAEVFELSNMLDDDPPKRRGSAATTVDADSDEDADVEDDASDDASDEDADMDVVPDMDLLLADSDDDEALSANQLNSKNRKHKEEMLALLAELEHHEEKEKKQHDATKAVATKQIRRGDLFAAEDQVGTLLEDENALQTLLGGSDDDDDMSMFSSAPSTGLSMADLMATIQRNQDGEDDDEEEEGSMPSAAPLAVHHVTKKINKMQRDESAQALSAPVSDVRSEAMVRAVAHDRTAEEVSKWEETVKKNRAAPQLKFPLNANTKKVMTSASLNADFTATNALEQDLSELIKGYGFSEEEMRKRERMVFEESKITKEALEEKNAKLRKMKAMMFYQEQKQKHIAKIKSRSQRKYLKKLKEKNQLSLEELEEIDPEAAEKKRLKQELDRVKERASLSHRNTSKWARQQLKRGALADKSTKMALQEQIRIGRELAQKMKRVDGEEEDADIAPKRFDQFGNEISYDSDDDSDAEEEKMRQELEGLQKEYGLDNNTEYQDRVGAMKRDKEEKKGLFGMAFMQRAENAKKEANKQLLEEMLAEENYDSDDEEAHARAAERARSNEIVVKKGRKEFGPDSVQGEAAAVPALMPNRAGVKSKNAFGGSLFDVDDMDDVEEEEAAPVAAAASSTANSKFVSAMAELSKQEAALYQQTLAGKAKKEIPDDDEESEAEEPAAKPVSKPADFATKKPRKGLSAEVAAAAEDELDLDSDEEANPWITRNTGATTADDALKRATKGAKQSKGTFKLDNEQTQGKTKAALNLQHANADAVVLDMSEPVLAGASGRVSDRKDERYDGADEDIDIMQQDEQAKLVEMAFSAGVDEMDEFEKQKLLEIGEDLPEEDPFAAGVPGWGAWGGAKVTKSKAQKRKEAALRSKHKADIEQQRAAILNARTDKNLRGVVINQQQDTKALKYQIDFIPSQFNSRDQYERTLRVPLGQEWNTQQAYQKLNAASVVVKEGQIINPIKWTKSMAKKTIADKAAEKKDNVKRKAAEAAATASAKKTKR
jgi:U3 small nucleolar RNA-associated protein 14